MNLVIYLLLLHGHCHTDLMQTVMMRTDDDEQYAERFYGSVTDAGSSRMKTAEGVSAGNLLNTSNINISGV